MIDPEGNLIVSPTKNNSHWSGVNGGHADSATLLRLVAAGRENRAGCRLPMASSIGRENDCDLPREPAGLRRLRAQGELVPWSTPDAKSPEASMKLYAMW
jgi:hypothetical protein